MAPDRSPAVASTGPRSLADELRGWDEDALVALLRERADLAVPVPHDLTTLAVRAASRASVQRVVDGLDTPALRALEVLAVLPEPTTAQAVRELLGEDAAPDLDRLRRLALVWGAPERLRLVRTARDLFGPHPAGLGPRLADELARRDPAHLVELAGLLEVTTRPTSTLAERLADRLGRVETVTALLETAPDGSRDVVAALTWGPPVGRLDDADRPVAPGGATTPVRWLLAHGLLAVLDSSTVALPREVAVALRGGRVHPAEGRDAPGLATNPVARAEEMAALAALEAVRLVEALGDLWGGAPPPVLRSGGLGVRELRRVATALEIPESEAALVVEIAHAAHLVSDDGELDPRWAPTPDYDTWRALAATRRWTALTTAWLATTRCPALVGTRDARNALRAALGPDLDRAMAPRVRSWLLTTLADLEPGCAAGFPDLVRLLDWTAPRRSGALRTALLEAAHAEAAWLGILGGGALAGFARPLLGTDRQAETVAAQALSRVLPPTVDGVLLQGDLTAVAPGRLPDALARELDLVADAESRGGGAVYRFSAASVRRALDAGRTGEDLLAWLRSASATPVPQPLEYLVMDTARRHGRVRVATAAAVVRSDDESVLSELLADRRAASLRLRRVAPTVLLTQAPPETVLDVLRAVGLAPAAETEDGGVVLARPVGRRTGLRSRTRTGLTRVAPPTPSEVALRTAAATLRLTEATPTLFPDDPPRMSPGPTSPAVLLTLLHRAADARRPVWVGYVEADGSPAQRLVEPIEVAGGRVSAFDRETARVRTFAIARVTAVMPA